MRRSIVGTLVLTAFAAAPGHAQQELLRDCAEPTGFPQALRGHASQLCAQLVNAITDLQPSVGIAFSGGNPVLGTGGTIGTRLGAIPHVSVTVRANGTLVDLPDVLAAGVGVLADDNPALDALQTVGFPIGAVQGDVAIGVFNGIGVGPLASGVGAIDLLGSVAYVPRFDEFGLAEPIKNIGVGARVGVLKQGLVTPGVSISGMYRRMGTVEFGEIAADGSGDPAEFSTNLSTFGVRGVVSKGILMFDLALGAGYDAYSSDVAFAWQLECTTSDCLAANDNEPQIITGDAAGPLETAAWNVFADVAVNVLMLNIVGEVGYQKAMDRIGRDDLSELGLEPDDLTVEALKGGRLFGSFGLRLAL